MLLPDPQLIQGDCLEIMPTLASASVDLILCDLPYGTTANKWDTIIPLEPLWAEYKRIIKPGAPIVLTCQQPFTTILAASNLKQLKTEWIWEKAQGTGFLNAKRYPLKSHENVLVFCERTPPYHPVMAVGKPYKILGGRSNNSENYRSGLVRPSAVNTGERYPTTVLRFTGDKGKSHPTQKPVALMEYLMKTYTSPGDTVLDNCMGSGTTGVACVNTGRSFIGIERDPAYFATAQQRILAVERRTA